MACLFNIYARNVLCNIQICIFKFCTHLQMIVKRGNSVQILPVGVYYDGVKTNYEQFMLQSTFLA